MASASSCSASNTSSSSTSPAFNAARFGLTNDPARSPFSARAGEGSGDDPSGVLAPLTDACLDRAVERLPRCTLLCRGAGARATCPGRQSSTATTSGVEGALKLTSSASDSDEYSVSSSLTSDEPRRSSDCELGPPRNSAVAPFNRALYRPGDSGAALAPAPAPAPRPSLESALESMPASSAGSANAPRVVAPTDRLSRCILLRRLASRSADRVRARELLPSTDRPRAVTRRLGDNASWPTAPASRLGE